MPEWNPDLKFNDNIPDPTIEPFALVDFDPEYHKVEIRYTLLSPLPQNNQSYNLTTYISIISDGTDFDGHATTTYRIENGEIVTSASFLQLTSGTASCKNDAILQQSFAGLITWDFALPKSDTEQRPAATVDGRIGNWSSDTSDTRTVKMLLLWNVPDKVRVVVVDENMGTESYVKVEYRIKDRKLL